MKKSIFTAAIAATLLFTGCDELEKLCGFTADDLGFTQDYTRHFNAATYVYQQSDRALRDPDLAVSGAKEIDGAQCTRTTDSLIIDYGNGAVGADGITRKGAIRMAVLGDYLAANGTVLAHLSNYYQADVNYEGNFNLANTTTGSQPQITMGITEFATTDASLNASFIIDWFSGFATQTNTTDDIFDISGNAVLTENSANQSFSGDFVTPVRLDASCPYTFVSGLIELMPSNTELPQVGIDFIDGDCDNLFKAKVTCEGNEFSFNYPIQ